MLFDKLDFEKILKGNERRKRYLRDRRKKIKALPYSRDSLISLVCGFASLGLFIAATAVSAQTGGSAAAVGALGMMGLVAAVGAFIIGLKCIKHDEDVKPWPAKAGAALGGAFLAVFAVLFILGLVV